MVDLRATNLKLRQRARNVLRSIAGQTCTKTDLELDVLLEACHGSVKLACASLTLGLSVPETEERLKKHNGVLARVLEGAEPVLQPSAVSGEKFVLCVDAGGSSCKAAIMSTDQQVGHGVAAPCNV